MGYPKVYRIRESPSIIKFRNRSWLVGQGKQCAVYSLHFYQGHWHIFEK